MRSEQNYHSNVLITERSGALILVARGAVQRGQGYHSECRTAVMTRSIKAAPGTGKSYIENPCHASLVGDCYLRYSE